MHSIPALDLGVRSVWFCLVPDAPSRRDGADGAVHLSMVAIIQRGRATGGGRRAASGLGHNSRGFDCGCHKGQVGCRAGQVDEVKLGPRG